MGRERAILGLYMPRLLPLGDDWADNSPRSPLWVLENLRSNYAHSLRLWDSLYYRFPKDLVVVHILRLHHPRRNRLGDCELLLWFLSIGGFLPPFHRFCGWRGELGGNLTGGLYFHASFLSHVYWVVCLGGVLPYPRYCSS